MNGNSFLRLNKSTRIKKYDDHCVVMNVLSDYQKKVSPLMAFILTLCDGRNTVKDITYIISKLFELEENNIKEHIDKKLEEALPFIDVSENQLKYYSRYQPKDFMYQPKGNVVDERVLFTPMKSPLVMTIALTDKCNFECVYCFKSSGNIRKNKPELSTSEWVSVVKQAKALEILKCNVTGGEPILHPGFLKIVETLAESEIYPFIATNGSLISKDIASSLSTIGIKNVQVSLDAPYSNTHHLLTRTQNTFDKVMKGIQYLYQNDIEVSVKSVITPYNYKETSELADLCVSLGVKSITIDKFNPGYGGRGENELILSTQMIEEIERSIEYKTEQYKGVISINSGLKSLLWNKKDDITPCGGFHSAFAIQPNGNMSICEQIDVDELVIGNIKNQAISEMWGSEKMIKMLNPEPDRLDGLCKNCEHYHICRTGCFSHTLLYEKNIYAADPSCWKVHLEKNPLAPNESMF